MTARDRWEGFLRELIRNFGSGKSESTIALSYIAKFLRDDELPACGRAFIAKRLELIVGGEDPARAFKLVRRSGPVGDKNKDLHYLELYQAEQRRLKTTGLDTNAANKGALDQLVRIVRAERGRPTATDIALRKTVQNSLSKARARQRAARDKAGG